MLDIQPVRVEFDPDPLLPRAFGGEGYAAGGDIAKLQADLARRLSGEGVEEVAKTSTLPVERAVRVLSATGGYLFLLVGYAAVALTISQYL